MIISYLKNPNEAELIKEDDTIIENEEQALNMLFSVTAIHLSFKLVYKSKDFYQFKSNTGQMFTVKNNNKRHTISGSVALYL